jgi:hypothetical protein
MKWPQGCWWERRHRSKLRMGMLPCRNWRLRVSGLATLTFQVMDWKGHAIAQAFNCQLPTTAAWVRAQVRPHGNCGRQSGTGAGFLRVLRLTLPIISPTMNEYNNPSFATMFQLALLNTCIIHTSCRVQVYCLRNPLLPVMHARTDRHRHTHTHTHTHTLSLSLSHLIPLARV